MSGSQNNYKIIILKDLFSKLDVSNKSQYSLQENFMVKSILTTFAHYTGEAKSHKEM